MKKSTSSKTLIKQKDVYQMLALSRSGLDKLKKRDKTFPRPIKNGDAKQASAYYVLSEIEAWLELRIAARDEMRS